MRPKSLALKISAATVTALLLSGCGGGTEALCTDAEVHKTLQKLVEQQELGAGAQLIPNVFSVQSSSATYVSTDKQKGTVRCSAVVAINLLTIMSLGRSEEDIAKIKVEAPKQGVQLTKEDVVNFTVQSLANGQFYVTLIP